MSNGDREVEILVACGLTSTEAKREDVRILAVRVAESEAKLERLQEQLTQTVSLASRDSLASGHIRFTTDGKPLASVVDLSVSIDVELVRVDERRMALRIVADGIVESR